MKNLYSFVFILLFPITVFCQPVNDDCAGIINFGTAPVCPAVLDTFNNIGATPSVISTDPAQNIPTCFNGGVVEQDVWFQFDTPVDGSIVDFTITVTGVEGGTNGAMLQPQVALYRGDCLVDELQELTCAISGLGESEVTLDVIGLTPGLDYFLRIEDWSASAASNEGDFVVCIDETPACFNMCDPTNDFSSSCEGKLYDSGGPDGDYSNGENCTFTICPDDFFNCLFINVVDYNIESGFDQLSFYSGNSTAAPLIFQLDGTGTNTEIQANSDCVTIQFTSDGSVANPGFFLEWTCSVDTCTIPPIISCDEPVDVPALPYVENDLSTCLAGNTVIDGPCNDFFLDGEDYIFTYDSPGDECIVVDITGSATQTGVAIYNDCPSVATECVASAGGGFFDADPTISGAFLENPGIYYIVVANPENCTDFNISIDTITCPVTIPSASECEDAVNINGCNNAPTTITVAQQPTTFLGFQPGCWGSFGGEVNAGSNMLTWFYFQAQEDGNFGFLASNDADPASSDIDINVWGPYDTEDELCDATITDEPARSTWSGASGPTGLIDINPDTGDPVDDTCEDAGGDKYVSTIPVVEGQWFVVVVADFGGDIMNGQIGMDFSSTTNGVFGDPEGEFFITPDTVVCAGEPVELVATGGQVTQWVDDPALSCVNCDTTIATVTETTTFQAIVNGACNSITLQTKVALLEVDAGPDVQVCLGESFEIIGGEQFESITYEWTGTGVPFLSCTDCPNPTVTATTAGNYTLGITATGGSCSEFDEMILEVLPFAAPQYDIIEDANICENESISLGGPDTGANYTWTSSDGSLSSNDANPSVNPTATTTYYLEVSNDECFIASLDSVVVEVAPLPVIAVNVDTTICQDDSLVLANITLENNVTYDWSPAIDITDSNDPNATVFPQNNTTYTLVADNNGCENQASVAVSVTQISIELTTQDTFGICVGESIDLSAIANPITDINWTPGDGSLNQETGTQVIASPGTATTYVATVEIDGCVRADSAYIQVDSLPTDLSIMPVDTSVCVGEVIVLSSPIYEPAEYGNIVFQWSPLNGVQTGDTLYNLVLNATETTTYQRISTNGFCSDTTAATVQVEMPQIILIDSVTPLCIGELVTLNTDSSTPDILEWSPSSGLSCDDCPNPIFTASEAGTFTYSVSDGNEGCPSEGTITLEVLPSPVVDLDNYVICQGDDVEINPNGDPNQEYVWTSNDDPDFGQTTEVNPLVFPSATAVYNVSVAGNGDCPTIEDSVLVEVIPADYGLNLPMDTTLVLEDGSVEFVFEGAAVDANGNIVIGDYTWLQNGGTVSSDGTVTIPYSETGMDSLVLVFVDGNNCDTVQQLIAITITDILIPNAFTPNGDEENENFGVFTGESPVEIITFQVFNRWGNTVFEMSDVTSDMARWNGGKDNNIDQPQPSDVYIYIIEYLEPDGSVKTQKGDITLIR